ncbi:MAG: DUF2189 domain-containing protein [Alphaproteobacteria bacterium]|nr:DUF2189 domain-containing protein [Alphaproteobacteria bacterium]MBM3647625.1 DUF2189 domain-containing protein [Alphaproteobacteria bacterium]
MTDAVPVFPTPGPKVRRVPLDRPWLWLARGWADLLRAPALSLGVGAAIAAVSIGLKIATMVSGAIYLALPLTAGFFLVAPLIAVGFYEISRRLGAGEAVSGWGFLLAWRRNGSQIALLGLLLMLAHLVWVRVATLLFALFFAGANPTFERLFDALIFSPVSISFLLTGGVVGLVLGAIVFSISVVSIPMLIDRDVNVIIAVATSLKAVRVNGPAMALWAALIVAFTAFGLVTFYLGLIVILPLLGHASWHAYRDVVEEINVSGSSQEGSTRERWQLA